MIPAALSVLLLVVVLVGAAVLLTNHERKQEAELRQLANTLLDHEQRLRTVERRVG